MKFQKVLFSTGIFLLLVGFYLYTGLRSNTGMASATSDHRGEAGGDYFRVPIFLFHNLDGNGRYSITRQEFQEYLEMIRESGVKVIPLKTLMEHAMHKRRLNHPSVVITIDDDFTNIVRVAAPLLREYRYPATFFVYIKDINSHPRGGLSWEDLNRIYGEGFEVQNHSWTHTRFYKPHEGESPVAYNKRVTREITDSRHVLEDKIPGNKIYAFAFPMGFYNDELKHKLHMDGYSLMLTTDGHPVNLDESFTSIFDRYTIERGDLQRHRRRFLNQLKIAHTMEHESGETQQAALSSTEAVSRP